MNAQVIYNSIGKYDTYGLYRAYNDTVDPSREWTLCGRLPESEKGHLRVLIRHHSNIFTFGGMICDMLDGDVTVIQRLRKNSKMSYNIVGILRSFYHIDYGYEDPWIRRDNKEIYEYCIDENDDYYVSDRDDQTMIYCYGQTVYNAVAEIILAEIAMRRRDQANYREYFYSRYAERYMANRQTMSYSDYDSVVGASLEPMKYIDKFTVEDVFVAFCAVNKLITTSSIWNVYGAGLMKCVQASMTEIINAIAASRAYIGKMAIFEDVPMSWCDVAVMVEVE